MAKNKAFVRYANNKLVPASVFIGPKAPAVGVWKEIPYDLCCDAPICPQPNYGDWKLVTGGEAGDGVVLINDLGECPTYTFIGPNDDEDTGWVYLKQYFSSTTCLEIQYEWTSFDDSDPNDPPSVDLPVYWTSLTEPTGIPGDLTPQVEGTPADGTWNITVPGGQWFSIGIYSSDSCCGRGFLQVEICEVDCPSFRSIWTANSTIELPYSPTGTYSGIINWGDGNTSVNSYANRIHNYATAGDYTITISGTIEGWDFLNYATSYRDNIKEILSWGPLRGENNSNANMFFLCSNLVLTGVTDTPDLTGITSLSNMFRACYSLITVNNMNSWDVSSVTNMNNMFFSAEDFNQDISSWDVSNVVTMTNMFRDCSFNQNISSWDVSSVINMDLMFYAAWAFNQDISGWNVSSATNMNGMFRQASAFNQDLSGWCVTLISSAPTNFDLDATAWVLPRPAWGTCPP